MKGVKKKKEASLRFLELNSKIILCKKAAYYTMI